MASTTTISGLPVTSSLTGTELVPVVQGGTTFQVTAQKIAALGGGGSGTITQLTSTGGTIAITSTTGPITNIEAIGTPIASLPVGYSFIVDTDVFVFEHVATTTTYSVTLGQLYSGVKEVITTLPHTIPAGTRRCLLHGVATGGTLTLPAAPFDGQVVEISTDAAIAAITLAASHTIVGAITTFAAAGGVSYYYEASLTSWERRY